MRRAKSDSLSRGRWGLGRGVPEPSGQRQSGADPRSRPGQYSRSYRSISGDAGGARQTRPRGSAGSYRLVSPLPVVSQGRQKSMMNESPSSACTCRYDRRTTPRTAPHTPGARSATAKALRNSSTIICGTESPKRRHARFARGNAESIPGTPHITETIWMAGCRPGILSPVQFAPWTQTPLLWRHCVFLNRFACG